MNAFSNILTLEEIESVKVLKHLDYMPAEYVNRVLREVATDVESFTSSNYRSGHRAADWLLRVAEALVDQNFHAHIPNPHSFTMADVIKAAEKAISNASAEYVEWWLDDPDHFIQYHPNVKVDKDGPVEHPWGNAQVELLRRWLGVRPYRIWTVYDGVRTATVEILEDSLLDILGGFEDCSRVQDAARQAFQRELDKVIAEFGGGVVGWISL